jgi:hypothetical protein
MVAAFLVGYFPTVEAIHDHGRPVDVADVELAPIFHSAVKALREGRSGLATDA